MKVGVVSDIHSNIVSFRTVMEDMPPVDELVCCGDIVGYGPNPSECLELVREKFDFAVMGNHDRMVTNSTDRGIGGTVGAGIEHSLNELSDEQMNWLGQLDEESEYRGYTIVHSHPKVTDRYVYPKQFSNMTRYAMENETDGVLLGHTHVQAAKKFDTDKGEILVSNPGSVGQPRDRNPKAAYGVLDTEKNDMELHRVSYDISEVQRRIKECGLPSKTGERLERGK